MKTDKDCINREDGQLDDDSLASIWGGSKVIRWVGKEIGKALISEAVSAGVQGMLNNLPSGGISNFHGQVAGGGYGNGGSAAW